MIAAGRTALSPETGPSDVGFDKAPEFYKHAIGERELLVCCSLSDRLVMRSATAPKPSAVAGSRPASARRPASAATGAKALGEIGALFRDLRRALKLSMPELAARVNARVDVIEALESGNVSRLPPWPETARIVTALTGLARIDPRPVLAIMRNEMWSQSADAAAMNRSSGKSRLGAAARLLKSAGADLSATLGAGARSAKISSLLPAPVRKRVAAALGRRPPGLWRIAIVAPLLLLAGLSQPRLLAASVAALPQPVQGMVSRAHDYILWRLAPEREGLRWIEVSDPQSRKSDKLQSVRR